MREGRELGNITHTHTHTYIKLYIDFNEKKNLEIFKVIKLR